MINPTKITQNLDIKYRPHIAYINTLQLRRQCGYVTEYLLIGCVAFSPTNKFKLNSRLIAMLLYYKLLHFELQSLNTIQANFDIVFSPKIYFCMLYKWEHIPTCHMTRYSDEWQ